MRVPPPTLPAQVTEAAAQPQAVPPLSLSAGSIAGVSFPGRVRPVRVPGSSPAGFTSVPIAAAVLPGPTVRRRAAPLASPLAPSRRAAVTVRVFPGDTADPESFTEIVKVIRGTFKLRQMVMVGDRGMITKARIEALNTAEDGTPRRAGKPTGGSPRCAPPRSAKLMADDGPLQMSLFDQQDPHLQRRPVRSSPRHHPHARRAHQHPA